MGEAGGGGDVYERERERETGRREEAGREEGKEHR